MDLHVDAEDLLRQLGSKKLSLRTLKLKSLDKLLHGHGDQVILNTYLLWLHEGFLAKTAPPGNLTTQQQRAGPLQSWCTRLYNFGFDHQPVFDALCNWNTLQFRMNPNAFNQDHFADVEKELEKIWSSLKGPWTGRKKHKNLDQPNVNNKAQPQPQFTQSLSSSGHDNAENREPMAVCNSQGIADCTKKPETIDLTSEIGNNTMKSLHHHSNDDSGAQDIARLPPHVVFADERKNTLHAGPKGDYTTNYNLASLLHHGQAQTVQVMPHNLPSNYVCHRCGLPGHHIADYDINLDHAYDKPPPSNYMCSSCGSMGKHFFGTCPKNAKPSSMTQLRLKYGIVPKWARASAIHHSGASPNIQDQHAVLPELGVKTEAGDGGQQVRSPAVAAEDFMHEDRRRAVLESGDGQLDGGDNFESRYMQAKQDYITRQRSPKMGPKYGHGNHSSEGDFESRYTQANRRRSRQQPPQGGSKLQYKSSSISPPPKRSRRYNGQQGRSPKLSSDYNHESYWTKHEGKDDRDRDRNYDHTVPSSVIFDSSSSHASTSDLLRFPDHFSTDRGRLSYWDSGYLAAPPALKKNIPLDDQHLIDSSATLHSELFPMINYTQSEDNREQEIKRLYPCASSAWVHKMTYGHKMAYQDVDSYILDVLMAPEVLDPFCSKTPVSSTDIIIEQSNVYSAQDSPCDILFTGVPVKEFSSEKKGEEAGEAGRECLVDNDLKRTERADRYHTA